MIAPPVPFDTGASSARFSGRPMISVSSGANFSRTFGSARLALREAELIPSEIKLETFTFFGSL